MSDGLDMENALAAWDEQHEGIAQVRENLKDCQLLTDNLMRVIDSFEERLTNMEREIAPLYTDAQIYSNLQSNVEGVIAKLDVVEKFVDVSNLTAESVSEEAALSDSSQFLDTLSRIDEAVRFFEEHPNLQDSEKIKRELVLLMIEGIKTCINTFNTLTEEFTESYDVEFLRSKWPLTNFQMIASEDLEILKDFAAMLDHCGNRAFLDKYIVLRATALEQTLSTHLDESGSTGIIKSPLKSYKGSVKSDPRVPYVKGTSEHIFYSSLFQKLLHMEKDILRTVVSGTSLADDTVVNALFCKLSMDPLHLFVKQSVCFWKGADALELFSLLDLLEQFDAKIPDFKSLIQSECHQIIQVSEQIRLVTQQAIDEQILTIHDDPFSKIPVSASYASITIETVDFLKKLLGYRNCINASVSADIDISKNSSSFASQLKLKSHSNILSLSKSTAEMKNTHIELPDDSSTPMSGLIVCTLRSLIYNLEHKARSFKRRDMRELFLLNNFHYLSLVCSSKDSVLSNDIGDAICEILSDARQNAKTRYFEETWSKLIEHITAFDDLTASFAAHGMTTSLKKGIKPRFSRFNDDFEAIFNAQVGGEIPDVELRSSLRHENIERVVPAYTAFYNAFRDTGFTTKDDKYMKYKPAILEQMLYKFFDNQ